MAPGLIQHARQPSLHVMLNVCMHASPGTACSGGGQQAYCSFLEACTSLCLCAARSDKRAPSFLQTSFNRALESLGMRQALALCTLLSGDARVSLPSTQTVQQVLLSSPCPAEQH